MPSRYLYYFRRAILLAIFLFSLLCQGQNALAQEIPNGDGDLLWERPLNGRTVNDALFHPINGNIIAAVNHEIWEIDPKDGHTIRVFEGGPLSGDYKYEFTSINISSDGNTIVTDEGSGIKGIIIWDYQTGKIKQNFDNGETISDIQCTGLFPDNNRVIYFSFVGQTFHLNVYDIQQNKLISQKNIFPNSPDFFRMSNDGKYIAFGFRYKSGSDMIYTMELWDAETLTKVKDFGSPGDINEFRDVQISDDNQYVGYTMNGGGWKLLLFNSQSKQLMNKYQNAIGFSFFKSTNKLIFTTLAEAFKPETNIITLPQLDTVYQYIKSSGFFRINSNNEILTKGFDTINGVKLQLLSKKWYEVGVNESKEMQATISPNPASDYISFNIPALEKRGLGGVLQEIWICDVFGNCVLSVETQCIASLQRIDISTLPAGTYLLRAGSEMYKFIVVR